MNLKESEIRTQMVACLDEATLLTLATYRLHLIVFRKVRFLQRTDENTLRRPGRKNSITVELNLASCQEYKLMSLSKNPKCNQLF